MENADEDDEHSEDGSTHFQKNTKITLSQKSTATLWAGCERKKFRCRREEYGGFSEVGEKMESARTKPKNIEIFIAEILETFLSLSAKKEGKTSVGALT